MCSRDPNLVVPELRRRIMCTIRDYKLEHPDDPRPFITCTVRTPEQQAEVWAQGRTRPGKIITWAEPGESPHNFNPSFAVDLAFRSAAGPCDWSDHLFDRIGRIAQRYGIEWGGDWLRPSQHTDNCHFQAPAWRLRNGVPVHDPWPEMPAERPSPYDTRPPGRQDVEV